jgi:hypothetical protein
LNSDDMVHMNCTEYPNMPGNMVQTYPKVGSVYAMNNPSDSMEHVPRQDRFRDNMLHTTPK